MMLRVSMAELGRNRLGSVFIASGAKCFVVGATLWSNSSLALPTKYESLGVNVATLGRQDWLPRAIGQLSIAQNLILILSHSVTSQPLL